MEDLQKLKTACDYMELMAMGINPATNKRASEGDAISEIRVQRCCLYVRDILHKIIDNNGRIGKRSKFAISDELISKIKVSEVPIGINDFAKLINAVKDETMRGISGTKIASWLASEGYLSIEKIGDNRTRKILNERSSEIGIISKEKVDNYTGEIYEQLLYTVKAQRFIIQNLDKIVK